MESPGSWKTAELVIMDAHDEWFEMDARGAIGLSRCGFVALKLRESGHLKDQDEPEIGFDKLRAHRRERKL